MASGSFIYVGKSRLRRKYRKQKIENRIKRKERRRQQREEAKRQDETTSHLNNVSELNNDNNDSVSNSSSSNSNNDDADSNSKNLDSQIRGRRAFTEIEHHSCRFCEDVDYADRGSFSSVESLDSEIIPLISADDSRDTDAETRNKFWKNPQNDKGHELGDNNNNSIKEIDLIKSDVCTQTVSSLEHVDEYPRETVKLYEFGDTNNNVKDSPIKWEDVSLVDDNKMEADSREALFTWEVSPNYKKKGCAPCCVVM